MKHLKKNQKGFTLIELLLVMAIIGILAAAVIVGIGNQRERARVTSALQTVKSAMGPIMDCHLSENAYATSNRTITNGQRICPTLPATFSMPDGYGLLYIYKVNHSNAAYKGHALLYMGELGTSGWQNRIACQYDGNKGGSCSVCNGAPNPVACLQ